MLRRLVPVSVLALALAVAAPALADPPANDNFENAAPLSGPPSSVTGSVTEATRQTGEPRHAGTDSPQTVWYAYRPSTSAPVAFDTCQELEFDTVLAVYTGSSLESLREVGASDDACGLGSRVAFSATAGETYWVAVASLSAPPPESAPARRNFVLRVTSAAPPANDDFVRASRLNLYSTVSGATWEASKELGEPRIGPAGKSVWYRYRARRKGRLTVDTAGSQFDTVLGVYRGRSVSSLRRVARNDDVEGSVAARLTFTARKGVTYYIALDGFGIGGEYTLSFSDDSVRGMGLDYVPDEGQTLSSARRQGLVGRIGCARSCQVRLDALVSSSTARGLGLRSKLLGSARGSLEGGRPELATIALSREASRALSRSSGLSVTIRVTLLGTTSRSRTLTQRIILGPP